LTVGLGDGLHRNTLAPVSSTPFDYDTAPERWRSIDRSTQLTGDVHQLVARLIVAEGLEPVVDVGGGEGELERDLPTGWPATIVDRSPTMLAAAPHPKLRARAEQLPVATASAGAVAMLWMLYHLERPEAAIREARRALRPGGLFAASTSARTNDPELTDGYPPTTFDAEEAEEIVGRVFDDVVVERWDDKLTFATRRGGGSAVLRESLAPTDHRPAGDAAGAAHQTRLPRAGPAVSPRRGVTRAPRCGGWRRPTGRRRPRSSTSSTRRCA
jgi:SAM-dependent methyltransferase